MTGFILALKSEQSQMFDKKGKRIPTTFLKTKGCYLIDARTKEKNGYFSLRLGIGQIKNIKKPVKGELEKAGIKTPLRFLKEFRIDNLADWKISEENNQKLVIYQNKKIFFGQEISPSLFFKIGDKVKVSGTSKGKGFQGVVKRHNFKGGPRTHGQSDRERAPGSIGMTTTPGRVFKGKRMAGRMGNQKVTIKGLEIIDIKEDGILVKGLVPGYKNGLIEVRKQD